MSWHGVIEWFRWVGRGFKPVPSTVFANVRVFAEHLDHWPDDDDVTRGEKLLSHRVYKDTACGAWLAFVREPPREKKLELKTYLAHLSQEGGPLGVARLEELKDGVPLAMPFNVTSWPREVREYLLLELPEGWSGEAFQGLGCHTIQDLFKTPPLADEIWTPDGPDRGTYQFSVNVPRELDPRDAPPFGIWGIQIGSIVEGSDAEVNGDTLYFPFTEEQYDAVIADVEEECDRLWRDANEEGESD